MFKRFIFFSFLILNGFSQIYSYSQEFISNSGKTISLMSCQTEDLNECSKIFTDSFLHAYKDFTSQLLGVQDKRLFLEEDFLHASHDFQMGKQKIIVAKIENKIIGLAGFKEAEKPGQIYITLLTVAPAHWKEGIGKQLVFSAFDIFENVKELVVITRKVNEGARNFYLKLGFNASPYMHPGYSPEKYIGYEWSKSE